VNFDRPSAASGLPGDAGTLLPQVLGSGIERVMAFCGVTERQLEVDVIARRRVSFYLEVDRSIRRSRATRELEKQWNPHGRSGS